MVTLIKENEKYFALGRRVDGADVKVEVDQTTYDDAQALLDASQTEDEIRVRELIEEAIAPIQEEATKAKEEVENLKKALEGLFAISDANQYEEWELGKAYKQGDIVKYDGAMYIVTLPHTSTDNYKPATETGKPMYTYIGDISEEGSIDEYPEWVPGQSYPIGFRAYYQGKLYEVVLGNADGMNTWAPDAYGWEEVTV